MPREKIHPLRRAVNPYLHMFKEEAGGTLRLPPTCSPDTGVWKDCNFDLALLKRACHKLLNSSARLKIEDRLIANRKEVIARLPGAPPATRCGPKTRTPCASNPWVWRLAVTVGGLHVPATKKPPAR